MTFVREKLLKRTAGAPLFVDISCSDIRSNPYGPHHVVVDGAHRAIITPTPTARAARKSPGIVPVVSLHDAGSLPFRKLKRREFGIERTRSRFKYVPVGSNTAFVMRDCCLHVRSMANDHHFL